MIRTRVSLFFALLLLIVPGIIAQNFRGIVDRFDLPEPGSVYSTTVQGGTVAIVDTLEGRRFTSGIIFRLQPSDVEGLGRGLYTVALYEAVDAPLQEGVVDIAGRLIERIPITSSSTMEIVIVFRGYESPPTPAGTIVFRDVDPSIGAIGLQLVPSGKGMTAEAARAAFPLEVSPILRSVGGLIVRLDGEESVVADALEKLDLRLEDRSIEVNEINEIPPGIYRLSADAGDLLSHTANVGIERATIHEVRLQVERPKAMIRLSVPSVSSVFWNGELLTETTITVEPGTHTVLIRLGNFSVSRQLELNANEEYEVGIDLDILLKRN